MSQNSPGLEVPGAKMEWGQTVGGEKTQKLSIQKK